jgi:hypothetical protein
MKKRNLPNHLNNFLGLDLNPGNIFFTASHCQLKQGNGEPDCERSKDGNQSENCPRVMTVEEKVESCGEVGSDVDREEQNVEEEEEAQL